jgi:hypothetical protein
MRGLIRQAWDAERSLISASDHRRWPNPRKGGPSAPASGGFGLDEALAIDVSRRQEIYGRQGPDRGLAAALAQANRKEPFLSHPLISRGARARDDRQFRR